jgi:hypothetical protein
MVAILGNAAGDAFADALGRSRNKYFLSRYLQIHDASQLSL